MHALATPCPVEDRLLLNSETTLDFPPSPISDAPTSKPSRSSFADVPVTEDGVETEPFLLSSDGLVSMFDLLGARVFAFVQADIRSNITGVQERFDSARPESATLEGLVRNEHAAGAEHGTQCYAVASHSPVSRSKRRRVTPNVHCTVCFRRAYNVALRHHHTFLVRSVVTLAIRAVPRRDLFYAQIAQGGDAEKFDAGLKRWLAALDTILQRMKGFLQEGGHGRV
ncbi:glycolipid transfer protein domain-containing protein [Mycena sp. CBHHK59/15]|nr:glycolipid transfer protein domain-containing protein [Mycena sp. CBHHK59/15]